VEGARVALQGYFFLGLYGLVLGRYVVFGRFLGEGRSEEDYFGG
jgi:hypothetical protein